MSLPQTNFKKHTYKKKTCQKERKEDKGKNL